MNGQSWDAVFKNLPALLAIALTIGGGLLIAAIAVITKAWQVNRESHRTAILKHEMLDRGMTPDEIVKVLEAGQKKLDD
jgi:uncharacterized membrane protein YozB (DUF420 family)